MTIRYDKNYILNKSHVLDKTTTYDKSDDFNVFLNSLLGIKPITGVSITDLDSTTADFEEGSLDDVVATNDQLELQITDCSNDFSVDDWEEQGGNFTVDTSDEEILFETINDQDDYLYKSIPDLSSKDQLKLTFEVVLTDWVSSDGRVGCGYVDEAVCPDQPTDFTNAIGVELGRDGSFDYIKYRLSVNANSTTAEYTEYASRIAGLDDLIRVEIGYDVENASAEAHIYVNGRYIPSLTLDNNISNLDISQLKYVGFWGPNPGASGELYGHSDLLEYQGYAEQGFRVSEPLDLTPVGEAESSLIEWQETLNGETITIETSVDDGSTWQERTNEDPISNLPTDLNGVELLVRQTLETDDVSITPKLNELKVQISTAEQNELLGTLSDSVSSKLYLSHQLSGTLDDDLATSPLKLYETIAGTLDNSITSKIGLAHQLSGVLSSLISPKLFLSQQLIDTLSSSVAPKLHLSQHLSGVLVGDLAISPLKLQEDIVGTLSNSIEPRIHLSHQLLDVLSGSVSHRLHLSQQLSGSFAQEVLLERAMQLSYSFSATIQATLDSHINGWIQVANTLSVWEALHRTTAQWQDLEEPTNTWEEE